MKNKVPHILVYVPKVDQTWGGIRQYTCTLIALLSTLENYHFYILHYSNDPEILRVSSGKKNITILRQADINISVTSKVSRKFKNLIGQGISRLLSIKTSAIEVDLLALAIEQYRIDVVHSPYQYLPKASKVKIITTIHDVQELHFPEFFTPSQREFRAKEYNSATKWSSHLIVSYNHVKSDLIRYFQVDSDRISVILLQMDKHWVCQMKDEDIVSLQTLSIPEHFLLYPANSWSHKNHEALIESVAYTVKEGKPVNVVLTGNFANSHGEYLIQKIADLGLENHIHILGIVDEKTLFTLYKTCVGVVVPTLYEAGSFPLMEAILIGVPVICSRTTSLPETIGEPEFIFDPKSISDMGDKAIALFYDSDFANRSLSNAISRRDYIVNTKADEKIKSIYEAILSS